LPLLRSDRTLRFVELPAGQDPDDVIRSGGREAFEEMLGGAKPLDARLWQHELEAEPLATPEAWAGLKERLVAHAATIGHADLARMYREDWLERFYQLRRPARAPTKTFTKTFNKGRWTPPDPPVGEQSRSIGRTGIDPRTARSLLVGFVNFPEALPDNAEQLAALPIDDPTVLRVRDDLVNQVYSGAELDRETLIPIFDTLGVASGTPSRGAMSFSFTRPDSDPDRARADLAAAIDTLMASDEVERALLEATERFKQNMSDEAYDEQQRLIAAQQTLRERLAHLAGTD
jgi:DNA primase